MLPLVEDLLLSNSVLLALDLRNNDFENGLLREIQAILYHRQAEVGLIESRYSFLE